jgi:hypothetical protein
MGTGTVDVAATTREGYLHVWDTPGLTNANHEAWHWHQDDRNTGHYGTDTRPPSAISDLVVTAQGSNDVLSFTAVGNDWKCGSAASYQLFTSASPIVQGNVGQATRITVKQSPHASGTKETITIAAAQNKGFLALRAVDAAGNIGPLPLTATASGGVAHVAQLGLVPASALPLVGVALLAAWVPVRRRRSVR